MWETQFQMLMHFLDDPMRKQDGGIGSGADSVTDVHNNNQQDLWTRLSMKCTKVNIMALRAAQYHCYGQFIGLPWKMC